MGSSQTKEKSSMSSSPSTERVIEGLKNKVRLLQGEIEEIMCIRDTESKVYERELMVFAFKQAEWERERERLKEEVKKLGKILEEKQEKLDEFENQHHQWDLLLNSNQSKRRDETVEKWKQLYFAIKLELDHLIHRTHQEERVWWKTEKNEAVIVELKNEVKAKEEIIEILQAKLAKMEQEESKREREMDILRQSLRIMSHNKTAPISLDRGQSRNFEL